MLKSSCWWRFFGRSKLNFSFSLPSIILSIDASSVNSYQTKKYIRTEELHRFLIRKNNNVFKMTDPKMAKSRWKYLLSGTSLHLDFPADDKIVWDILGPNYSVNFPYGTRWCKWNESGFRPPLCTYRLNLARKTSWRWGDDPDDTVLQTQDSKFEPRRSEAQHATSRSRRLPTILTFTRG